MKMGFYEHHPYGSQKHFHFGHIDILNKKPPRGGFFLFHYDFNTGGWN